MKPNNMESKKHKTKRTVAQKNSQVPEAKVSLSEGLVRALGLKRRSREMPEMIVRERRPRGGNFTNQNWCCVEYPSRWVIRNCVVSLGSGSALA